MLDNHVGNNLLYLLSEKKTMLYTSFKGYIDKMYGRKDKYFAYNLIRNLSALGYLGLGNDKKGRAIISVSPPLLIELPFISSQFMMIGARSPELLNVTKDIATIKQHEDLPDSVFVSPHAKDKLLSEKSIHGDTLSSFIRIPSRPWAWDILEFSGNLSDYRQLLQWHDGDREHIKEIFDTQEMTFKNYDGSKIEGEVLVKVSHYERFTRHYLLNVEKNKAAKVNRDWGRFLALQATNQQVLKYDKRTLTLISSVHLPLLLERGLSLCAGRPPERCNDKQEYSFIKIVPKIAKLVADKLRQQLYKVKFNE